ncbi:MAG: hypothetical protein ACHQ6T_12265 [Myxococcota bacterium]
MLQKSRTGLALALSVALGCAMFEARKEENLLQTAGFRVVAANTSEKIQALNSLPAGKISRVDRNGTIFYVFPDAKGCRCLRVGREEQYVRYERLAASTKATRFETVGSVTSADAFKGYDPW